MKNITLQFAASLLLVAPAFTAFQSINWKIKNDYSVKFNGGTFTGLKAFIVFDEAHPETSKITASIDARTINTGQRLKDTHAKDIEGLDVDRFPLITFVSTAITKTSLGYEATGNLTLKGITKEIKLPFIFDSRKMSDQFPFVDKETFSGRFTIVPKDFNVTRSGTPKEVTIQLTIPVMR